MSFNASDARRFSRRYARRSVRPVVKESAVRAARKAVRRAVRKAQHIFQESISYDSDSSNLSGANPSSMSDVSDVSGASQISAKSGFSGRKIGYWSSDSESDPDVAYEEIPRLSILCRRFFRDHYTIEQISQFDPFVLGLLDFGA